MKKNLNSGWLLAMFFAAFVLFVLGPIQGNPVRGVSHEQMIVMNSPPGQAITIAVQTPDIPVFTERIESIQIARGVSVPIKGYMINIPAPVERSKSQGININYNCRNLSFVYLDDRYSPIMEGLSTNKDFSKVITNFRAREKL
jgi:hypothetical protein